MRFAFDSSACKLPTPRKDVFEILVLIQQAVQMEEAHGLGGSVL